MIGSNNGEPEELRRLREAHIEGLSDAEFTAVVHQHFEAFVAQQRWRKSIVEVTDRAKALKL